MYTKSWLKWAGQKTKLIPWIHAHLPVGPCDLWCEAFVGSGAVWMNTPARRLWLNDINDDLMACYRALQQKPDAYMKDVRALFCPSNNTAERYYQLRQEFNDATDEYHRACLFVYLNRYGFRGLCRYSERSGFNVPYGWYKNPYYPEVELALAAERIVGARLTCWPFERVLAELPAGAWGYFDPPYIGSSETSNFTAYAQGGFTENDQQRLAQACHIASNRGVHVLVSNSDTLRTRQIYQAPVVSTKKVLRQISCKERNMADEVLMAWDERMTAVAAG